MKDEKALGGMGKPSRSREQGFEQGPRKATGQLGWGTGVGTVEKRPGVLPQNPLPELVSCCLEPWRAGKAHQDFCRPQG